MMTGYPQACIIRYSKYVFISVVVVVSLLLLVQKRVPTIVSIPKDSPSMLNRLDCHPDPWPKNSDHKKECLKRGCHYDLPKGGPKETPACYFPQSTGYKVKTKEANGYTLEKDDGVKNPFGKDISPLDVKINKLGGTLEVSIGTSGRYVPPLDLPKEPSEDSDPIVFEEFKGANGTFAFRIFRKRTGVALWDTSIGGLLFADKFLQIATYLPSKNVYGFGEHVHKKMKHDLSRYTTWPMWARGLHPNSKSSLSTANLYAVHPFYLCIEPNGDAHGMFFLNSNAQEVTLGPAPHLIYRTIGGQLDMVFFSGPTPEKVIQGYVAYIGRPILPAYWSLGFQLSRYGYRNLDHLKTSVNSTIAAGVPLDVIHTDIEYMNAVQDFTIAKDWEGLPAYVRELKSKGVHLVPIIDAGIEVDYDVFQRAVQAKVSFIGWPKKSMIPKLLAEYYPMTKNTNVMLGRVWPKEMVAFPDFLDPTSETTEWWTEEFKRFHKLLPFDGIWIDMNEPASYFTRPGGCDSWRKQLFCPTTGANNEYDNPPYKTKAVRPREYIFSATLCMCGTTARGTHKFYNTRNLYGWSESRATRTAQNMVDGKRGIVLSRSTFPSSGRYAGTWLGDNRSSWDDLKTSVIGVMEFNMFGIPYVGSDICGFGKNVGEQLCLRWHQFGAFSPFSRNHNNRGTTDQYPAVWPKVANATRISMLFRYQYLPYLYSLHYTTAVIGGTVVRPVFFEFPRDQKTLSIDYQFMWGSAMMIAPVVYKDKLTVIVYFPDDRWYSLHPLNYARIMRRGHVEVAAPLVSLPPVFVRGGHILPRQTPSTTTTESRKNPFDLLITLGEDPYQNATGIMYCDDGEAAYNQIEQNPHFLFNFSFVCTNSYAELTIVAEEGMKMKLPTLDIIEVFGYPFLPELNSLTFNNNSVVLNQTTSFYDSSKQLLLISSANLINLNEVSVRDVNVLRWNHRLSLYNMFDTIFD